MKGMFIPATFFTSLCLDEFMRPLEKPKKTTDDHVIDAMRENNPETVKELIELVQLKCPIPQEEILERILHLQNQGKIALKKHLAPEPSLLRHYIVSPRAAWYWEIIAVAAITAVLVFTVPENAYPVVYVRHMLVSVFVLFLPGYSFVKTLFPTKELGITERTTLSIGLSLALVALIGLLVSYTPWGITTTPVTASLLAITTILATAGIIREHQAKLGQPTAHSRDTTAYSG
jgi:hypothetical protein